MAIYPGIKEIALPCPPDSQVAYCGIAVHAGSRNETAGQQGLAHFCEHLAFKGTSRRSARKIINDIEGLGGELNAFTNKEDTVFYCAIERRHLRRAIDVLLDIVFCSQYPEQEVEKEREVVCDEIESYEDSPADLIYDDFENILFAGHPLGHNILGSAELVRSFTASDARRFTSQWYRPENSVLFVTRERPTPFLSPREGGLVASVANDSLNGNQSPLPWGGEGGGLIFRHRNTHQAHVMVGGRAYAASDPRRWTLYLLNNIIGGSAMNSRLNLSLRERHGLVYTVESSMTSYSDAGLWGVYFGCDPHDTDRCLRLVRRELERMADKPVTERQLRAAKQQLQGQLAIASENREQFAIDYARTVLHTGHGRTLADVMRHIDGVGADDLLSVARQLFQSDRIVTLVYQ